MTALPNPRISGSGMNSRKTDFWRIFCVLFVLLPMLGMQAQTYWTPENLPMVYLQDRTKYVNNPEGILGQSAVDSIDSCLYALEQETGIQTVVVVVGHIEGDDPYQFGQAIADKYGIGQKGKDNGLFVMLCTEDRSYTILTGDGMEGVLPDASCRRIQNRIMVPLLREGRWDDAMVATIKAIDGYVRGDETFRNAIDSEEEDDGLLAALLLMGGMSAAMVALIYFASRKKCPKCGKRKMRAVAKKVFMQGGERKIRVTYRCTNCGEKMTRVFNYPDDDAGALGGMVGGGFGGGMSRGGYSGPVGGHFGGGHFGGGGSTGRF